MFIRCAKQKPISIENQLVSKQVLAFTKSLSVTDSTIFERKGEWDRTGANARLRSTTAAYVAKCWNLAESVPECWYAIAQIAIDDALFAVWYIVAL